MAKSVNMLLLIGRLGNDPEVKELQSGLMVATLSVATNHSVKNADGQWSEETDWHRVVLFGKQAEFCRDYAKKGSLVYVEGRIQYRKYQKADSTQELLLTEVVAKDIQLLSPKTAVPDVASTTSTNSGRGGNGKTYRKQATKPTAYASKDFDDDINF
jgi:single-strand DNA-binding protein